MASDADMLNQLLSLLKEFYAVNTDNSRKKEIETVLSHFGQQQNAWKLCLYFIQNTHDEYVLMFCLNVLESVVSQQWIGIASEDRLQIRMTVYHLLLVSHSSVSSFLRNKMAKLIVYIARQEWPHAYPDFFSNIISLIEHGETAVLGLVMLQTASEELASPRDDLIVARKEELHQLMLKQMPAILTVLNGVLELILQKPRVAVDVSPVPSHDSQPSYTGHMQTAHHSALRNSVTPKSAACATNKAHVLDPHSTVIAQLALNCLSHFFSWIPMQLSAAMAPAKLLENIFHYAVLGCQPLTAGSTDAQSQLGEAAMSCINELLSKNRVPADCEKFLLTLFGQTYTILLRLANSDESVAGCTSARLDQLSNSFADKFTEFLQLFVSTHLKRFESNPHFPIIDFLALLFKYTFMQRSFEGFYNCLHIWSEFLDYLQQKLEPSLSVKEPCLAKYKDVLISLATQLLHKLQFRFNQTQLEELDDDILDDDCKTEWQYYLGECLELLAKISQLYPNIIFSLLSTAFHSNLDTYIALEHLIDNEPAAAEGSSTAEGAGSSRRRLKITAENDCRRLHCALRDLSSLLQALGRLADHFTGEDKFTATFSDGSLLVDRLLRIAVYSTRVRLYETSCAIEDVLKADFTEVHAQSLAALRAYSMWLAQFYVQTHRADVEPNRKEQCDAMIASTLEATVPLLTLYHSVPEKVLLSCAHLLLSVFTTLRPAHLYNFVVVQHLYAEGIKIDSCPLEVELLVVRALSHYLMLPWSGGLVDSQQDWPERAARLGMLFQRTLHDYTLLVRHVARLSPAERDLIPACTLEQGKTCLRRALCIMTDVVDTLGVSGVSRSKELCYSSLRDYVDSAVQLLNVYIHHADVVDQLLGFFLAVFQCLRVQMGVPVTEKLIQMFMTLFTREQLLQSLQQETAAGHQLIDKFLKILQVIVLEPSASFKAFLPSILDLCLHQVYPILAERDSPDVKPTLYELLFKFLHCNWRFFFRSSLANKHSSIDNVEQMENRQQFVAIIQAFGQSFLQSDITIFRQNLQSLETLNAIHQLYHKAVMQTESLLASLLTVLLRVLIQRSHALLHDEIAAAIYNMAAVNLNSFYGEFIVHFLKTTDSIADQHRQQLLAIFHHEQDLPSFTQNIHRFVSDLRYYQLCHSRPA